MGSKLKKIKCLPGTQSDEATSKGQHEDGSMSPTYANLTVSGTLTASALSTDSVAPAITAHAGGGQQPTEALTKNLNIVTTVTTAADSVTLPSATAGLRVTVVNLGANALAVFPYTSDSIDNLAVNLSVTIHPESSVTFNCYTTVKWQSDIQSIDAFDKIYLASDIVTAKEVDHTISVTTTTTAATAGGAINITAGTSGTSGTGGAISATSGTGGTTGTGGAITLSSGAAGSVSGNSGAATLKTPNVTVAGNTGAVTISSGNAANGDSGNITIQAGTATGVAGTVTLKSATNTGWVVNASGAFVAGTDNTYDIGNAAADPRDINLVRDVVFRKAVNHNVAVTDSTVATNAGGTLTLQAGAGNTTGAGGDITVKAGNSGATAGTAGGNVVLTPGTNTSTTVSSVIVTTANKIRKPLNTASVATAGSITGKQLVDGYIAITGGTGNVALPAASAVTTALGTSPAGTTFDFIVNASGMTATNVATLTLGANTVTLKQTSSGDAAVDQLLTITQTSGLHIGIFRIVFDTATSMVVSRIG